MPKATEIKLKVTKLPIVGAEPQKFKITVEYNADCMPPFNQYTETKEILAAELPITTTSFLPVEIADKISATIAVDGGVTIGEVTNEAKLIIHSPALISNTRALQLGRLELHAKKVALTNTIAADVIKLDVSNRIDNSADIVTKQLVIEPDKNLQIGSTPTKPSCTFHNAGKIVITKQAQIIVAEFFNHNTIMAAQDMYVSAVQYLVNRTDAQLLTGGALRLANSSSKGIILNQGLISSDGELRVLNTNSLLVNMPGAAIKSGTEILINALLLQNSGKIHSKVKTKIVCNSRDHVLVNTAAGLIDSDGAVNLGTNSKLDNYGKIAGHQILALDVAGDLKNFPEASISAKLVAKIASFKDIINQAHIAAGTHLGMAAHNLVNQGVINVHLAFKLAAILQDQKAGKIAEAEAIALITTALPEISSEAKFIEIISMISQNYYNDSITANKAIELLNAALIINTNDPASLGSLTIHTKNSISNLAEASMTAAKAIKLISDFAIINQGTIETKHAKLAASKFLHLQQGGKVDATKTATLTAEGVVHDGVLKTEKLGVVSNWLVNSGTMQAKNISIRCKEAVQNLIDGKITATEMATIFTEQGFINLGALISRENLSILAKDLYQAGTLGAAHHIYLKALDLFLSGNIQAGGDLLALIDGHFAFDTATLKANGEIELRLKNGYIITTPINTPGGLKLDIATEDGTLLNLTQVTTGKDLIINAPGCVLINGVEFGSKANFNAGGSIEAQTKACTMQNGGAFADKDLSLQTESGITISKDAFVASNGSQKLVARQGGISHSGAIYAGGDLTAQAATVIEHAGGSTTTVIGKARIKAPKFTLKMDTRVDQYGSTIYARSLSARPELNVGGDLELDTSTEILAGALHAGGKLKIKGQFSAKSFEEFDHWVQVIEHSSGRRYGVLGPREHSTEYVTHHNTRAVWDSLVSAAGGIEGGNINNQAGAPDLRHNFHNEGAVTAPEIKVDFEIFFNGNDINGKPQTEFETITDLEKFFNENALFIRNAATDGPIFVPAVPLDFTLEGPNLEESLVLLVADGENIAPDLDARKEFHKVIEAELIPKARQAQFRRGYLENVARTSPQELQILMQNAKEFALQLNPAISAAEAVLAVASESVLENAATPELLKQAIANHQFIEAPGLTYQAVPKDGHCLYSSLAIHLGQSVAALRNQVATEIAQNVAIYRDFIVLPPNRTIADYIAAVRNTNEWADDLEISILMQILDRPIITIGRDGKIVNRQVLHNGSGEPIFVYYNGRDHYDAAIVQDGFTARGILTLLEQPEIPQGSVQAQSSGIADIATSANVVAPEQAVKPAVQPVMTSKPLVITHNQLLQATKPMLLYKLKDSPHGKVLSPWLFTPESYRAEVARMGSHATATIATTQGDLKLTGSKATNRGRFAVAGVLDAEVKEFNLLARTATCQVPVVENKRRGVVYVNIERAVAETGEIYATRIKIKADLLHQLGGVLHSGVGGTTLEIKNQALIEALTTSYAMQGEVSKKGRNYAIVPEFIPAMQTSDGKQVLLVTEGKLTACGIRIHAKELEVSARDGISSSPKVAQYDLPEFNNSRAFRKDIRGGTSFSACSNVFSGTEGLVMSSSAGDLQFANTTLISSGKTKLAALKVEIKDQTAYSSSYSRRSGFSGFSYQDVAVARHSSHCLASTMLVAGDLEISADQLLRLRGVKGIVGGNADLTAPIVIAEGGVETTETTTTSNSVGLSFFGSDAIEAVINDEEGSKVLEKLLQEDSFFAAADKLAHAKTPSAKMQATVKTLLEGCRMAKFVSTACANTAKGDSMFGQMTDRWGLTKSQYNADGTLQKREFNPVFTIGTSHSVTHEFEQQTVATDLKILGDLTISGDEIHLIDGTKIKAKNITIIATKLIEFAAARNIYTQRSTSSGTSVTFAGSSIASVGQTVGRSSADGVSYAAAEIAAEQAMVLEAPEARLYGAILVADTVAATFDSLTITTPQDTFTQHSENVGVSVGLSGTTPSVGVNISGSSADSRLSNAVSGITARSRMELSTDALDLTGAFLAAGSGFIRRRRGAGKVAFSWRDNNDYDRGESFSASVNVGSNPGASFSMDSFNQEGHTLATISGLNIDDLEDSAGIHRDLATMQQMGEREEHGFWVGADRRMVADLREMLAPHSADEAVLDPAMPAEMAAANASADAADLNVVAPIAADNDEPPALEGEAAPAPEAGQAVELDPRTTATRLNRGANQADVHDWLPKPKVDPGYDFASALRQNNSRAEAMRLAQYCAADQHKTWRPKADSGVVKTYAVRQQQDSRGRTQYRDIPKGSYAKSAAKSARENFSPGKTHSRFDTRVALYKPKVSFNRYLDLTERQNLAGNPNIETGIRAYAYLNDNSNVTFGSTPAFQVAMQAGAGFNLLTAQHTSHLGTIRVDVDGPSAHGKLAVAVDRNGGKFVANGFVKLASIKGEFTSNHICFDNLICLGGTVTAEAGIGLGAQVERGYQTHKTRSGGSQTVGAGRGAGPMLSGAVTIRHTTPAELADNGLLPKAILIDTAPVRNFARNLADAQSDYTLQDYELFAELRRARALKSEARSIKGSAPKTKRCAIRP